MIAMVEARQPLRQLATAMSRNGRYFSRSRAKEYQDLGLVGGEAELAVSEALEGLLASDIDWHQHITRADGRKVSARTLLIALVNIVAVHIQLSVERASERFRKCGGNTRRYLEENPEDLPELSAIAAALSALLRVDRETQVVLPQHAREIRSSIAALFGRAPKLATLAGFHQATVDRWYQNRSH